MTDEQEGRRHGLKAQREKIVDVGEYHTQVCVNAVCASLPLKLCVLRVCPRAETFTHVRL